MDEHAEDIDWDDTVPNYSCYGTGISCDFGQYITEVPEYVKPHPGVVTIIDGKEQTNPPI